MSVPITTEAQCALLNEPHNSAISPSDMTTHILLVDDFEPWRHSVCAMLKAHQQFEVVGEAVDGLEAVQKAQEMNPDLILLDVGLPKLNGIEAAHRIAEVVPGAKVLFVTQESTADVVSAAMSNGAYGYVVKSEAGSDLLPAIETALRGGRFLSARLRG